MMLLRKTYWRICNYKIKRVDLRLGDTVKTCIAISNRKSPFYDPGVAMQRLKMTYGAVIASGGTKCGNLSLFGKNLIFRFKNRRVPF